MDGTTIYAIVLLTTFVIFVAVLSQQSLPKCPKCGHEEYFLIKEAWWPEPIKLCKKCHTDWSDLE